MKNRRPLQSLLLATAVSLACGCGEKDGPAEPLPDGGEVVTADLIAELSLADGEPDDSPPEVRTPPDAGEGGPDFFEVTEEPAPPDGKPEVEPPEAGPEVPETIGPFCGDGQCNTDAGEHCNNCKADCPVCNYICGNKKCEAGEDQNFCPPDCGPCGDDLCGLNETNKDYYCAADCQPDCGNGKCDGGETGMPTGDGLYCPADCGYCGDGVCGFKDLNLCTMDCDVGCGDKTCAPEESYDTCPIDCVNCGDGVCLAGEECPPDCVHPCGDGLCEGGETATSCPADCGPCGDGTCGFNELAIGHCPADCPKSCGDGTCAPEEGASACPADCACKPACDPDWECGEDPACQQPCGACPAEQPTCENHLCV
jgi:hypothetical protein